MAKSNAGRPTVMTPEVISKLEEAFSMGCGDREACLHANISTQPLYDYQTLHPEFTERKAMLKEKLILKSRQNVQLAIDTGDRDMTKWYLERKKKAEFSTRSESIVERTDVKGWLDGLDE